MDALGITLPVIPPLPASPSVQGAPSPILPAPAAAILPDNSNDGADLTPQVIDQKRYQAVKQAAQDIANVYIVGDKHFSIFKDATGQYITRFTSLRDGKVTYIPEPTLIKHNAGTTLNIKV